MDTPTWAERIAGFLMSAYRSPIPGDVLSLAGLQLLDTVACAAGAVDAEPIRCALRSIEGSGPQQATVWFSRQSASIDDATLVNGTAVRFLDANDVFLGTGPGGHPSDNIPVALAAAERFGATGYEVLTAIALAYELVFRLRTHIFRHSPRGSDWHEVSISGVVAASITALLGGADRQQLTNAICIGAAKGYALKEIRRGQISMLKAAGNAVVAREGVMSALLALNGLSGPRRVFEGESGLVVSLGGEPLRATIDQICLTPEWSIRRISVKPYPAFGTAQAAIVAATSLASSVSNASSIERVIVSLRDSSWTRDYINLAERRRPETRETADHSIHFLVAVALLEGGISQLHYEERLWERDHIRSLMAKISVEAKKDLGQSDTSFPAAVKVVFNDGKSLSETVRDTPGSPANPWGVEEIVEKFGRLDRVGLTRSRIEEISQVVIGLESASDLCDLTTVIR